MEVVHYRSIGFCSMVILLMYMKKKEPNILRCSQQREKEKKIKTASKKILIGYKGQKSFLG